MSHMMWFLGAGTSRSANMPTAYDLIWDLKLRYYCREENQDLQKHDINNKSVRRNIQTFLDSRSFPKADSPEEYSFYFDLIFRDNLVAQRRYLDVKLAKQKISPNIGHRILAALMASGSSKLVFTTNFDEVIEQTFSEVNNANLTAFSLEGSYAASEALIADSFPIYVKLHGDFKFHNLKNLSQDLLSNDKELQKCFLSAANRFGLIISGYSGRDKNVMDMFYTALDQPNPFPLGLFWTTTNIKNVGAPIRDFIDTAKAKGVNAHSIEIGTFDELLSKLWRQLPDRPNELHSRIFTAIRNKVSIPLPGAGNSFPLIRTNALPILSLPKSYGVIKTKNPISYKNLNDAIFEKKPDAIITYVEGKVCFWGSPIEVYKVLNREEIVSEETYQLDAGDTLLSNTHMQAFVEQALVRCISESNHVISRKKGKTYFAVVNERSLTEDCFLPLEQSVGFKGDKGKLKGHVPGLKNVNWFEAVSIKLENRNGKSWLILKPDIWISPLAAREDSTDFLRNRRRYRYNKNAYEILDAWISILFGSVGKNQTVTISAFEDTQFSCSFEIATRTAYSKKIRVIE